MKKIILCLLLFVPIFVFAGTCDTTKHQEYINYASKITYDNSYSKSTSRFTVTLYNVIDGLRVKYNNKYYEKSEDDTVTIGFVPEGTSMVIEIYDDEECDISGVIYINQLYFNQFYGSNECVGYENKIRSCTAQFTTIKVTKESLEMAKSNYDNNIVQEKNNVEKPKEELTTLDKITSFMLNWGIKILLLAITCIISIAYYNSKFRKIKHGI